MKRSSASVAPPMSRRSFLVAISAFACIPFMKGHTETREQHTQDKSKHFAQVRSIQEARAVIRQNVHHCIDECGIQEGATFLRKCWGEHKIDGTFMAELDASFSPVVAEKIRTIARVLVLYPELAAEIPSMATTHLQSRSAVDLKKRIGLYFLRADLPLLRDKKHIQTSAATYIALIEEREKVEHLLTTQY